jgi:hypothetical protein
MESEQSLKEYNPYYILGKTGETIYYERRWYCAENKVIHGSEKEVMNCKFCFSREKR